MSTTMSINEVTHAQKKKKAWRVKEGQGNSGGSSVKDDLKSELEKGHVSGGSSSCSWKKWLWTFGNGFFA